MPKTLEWRKIIDALSAQDAAGVVGPVAAKAGKIKFLVVFSTGTSAGAVQIEESHGQSGFGGTWATLGAPVAWAVANSVKSVLISEPCQSIRARISTAIVGGTVDVWVLVSD